MKIEFIDHNNSLFPDVIKLGKKHSSTLGFMPEGGYIDHAQRRCIIIAYDDSNLMGYLMFREVNRYSRIVIVHLCVQSESQGKGISAKLLDALREKYSQTFQGISLQCRQDYSHATKLWEKYGFVCKGQQRSRSIDENYLNKWWYDFNHPDLFSYIYDSLKIKALLDANIIFKLRDNTDYEPSQDPRPLIADWLIDEVDYYYAPESFNEILRDTDKSRAEKTRNFFNNYIEARYDIEKHKDIATQLQNIITGTTDNDESDRKQLAACIVFSIPYFITLDTGILQKREELGDLYDIQIFTPQEFILEIDQLINQEEYSPRKLDGVTFHSMAKVTTLELYLLINNFLHTSFSEKKNSFKDIVYKNHSYLNVIKCDNEAIAFFANKYENKVLIIPFVRLSNINYERTLFMQIISNFINEAVKKDLSKVIIEEIYLSDEHCSILQKLGFEKVNEAWIKTIHNKIIEIKDIIEPDNCFVDNSLVEMLKKEGNIGIKNILLKIERKLFPLKISDLDIPCYIIPIIAHWAGHLFDPNILNDTLFGSNLKTLWNIENVYYRSIKPINEIVPARILWYVSNDMTVIRSKSIVASSYLDEVMIDLPKKLFSQNRHYGIYEWDNIFKLCKENINNPIKALRFSGTEVFRKHVEYSAIQQIFLSNGRKPNTFPSPVRVDQNIFTIIYRMGTCKQ
ncbi:hypothetical protein AGMMS49546_10410 [Spirochaetia bacterium]|nr:hypothetical protein AGMMS49546_10410 [Spirochaetia bacterium]